ATRGPVPGVIVSGGDGRSRSGMKVNTSRDHRSRPTMSTYSELVAMSLDPNHARARTHQSLVDERIQHHRNIRCGPLGGGRARSRVQLLDRDRRGVAGRGAEDGAAKLTGAPAVPGRASSRFGRRRGQSVARGAGGGQRASITERACPAMQRAHVEERVAEVPRAHASGADGGKLLLDGG